jgi:hypothetical protein
VVGRNTTVIRSTHTSRTYPSPGQMEYCWAILTTTLMTPRTPNLLAWAPMARTS